jgi:hypothetical protein
MAALAAILLPSSLTAQITFQRTYGGAGDEWGESVQQTTDGGYIIVGSTESFGAGSDDFYLIKTDSRGDTLWTRTYGGTDWDYGSCGQQTVDGGFIIAGWTNISHSDVYLIRTDVNGETLWTRRFGGAKNDRGESVQQTADGGYVIAGWTSSFGAGSSDIYLVRTDARGDTMWTKTFGGALAEYGYSVEQTSDGGFIVAGRTASFGAGGLDIYLIKTDAGGDTLWTRTLGGVQDDYGRSVRQTTDGGYVVAGNTDLLGAGQHDVYLVKTDANGNTLWTRTFGGANDDEGSSVQQTADGGYIVVGYIQFFGTAKTDVYLIRTDANGDTLWTRVFGGTGEDYGCSVRQTADGGYVIAGYATSFGTTGRDVYLIKTDSLGNVAVAEPKTSPTRAPALSLSCEPNPSSGSVTISLSPSIPSSLSPVLRIYDSQGRMVLSRQVSTSSFPLSTSDLSSGAYFAVLAAAGQHATTRLVLQR